MAPTTNAKKRIARSNVIRRDRLLLDEHHGVELRAVLPREFVLGAEYAEEREHGFLGGTVVPVRAFDEQVEEGLEGIFELFFAGEFASFVIDDGFFALDVFLGDFGVEVEKFQERFRFAVLVVAFDKLGENFFCLFGIAEAEACLGPQKQKLLVVGRLGEGVVQCRDGFVKALFGDGLFEFVHQTGFVGDVEFFEALLEVGFGEHALDDVCNLAFVHHVNLGNGLHAEHLDEAHVFAVIATDDAKRKVKACGK